MRRQTDRLFVLTLGPREREALELVRARPGITVGELRAELGVGTARIWQIVNRLEARAGLQRQGGERTFLGPPRGH